MLILSALLVARPAGAVDLDIRGDTYSETGTHSFDDILTDDASLIALDTVYDSGNPTAGDLNLTGTFAAQRPFFGTPTLFPNTLDGEIRVGANNILTLNTAGNPDILLPLNLTLASGIIRSNSKLLLQLRTDGFTGTDPHISGEGLIIGDYEELTNPTSSSRGNPSFTRAIDLGSSNASIIANTGASFNRQVTMSGGTLGFVMGGASKTVQFFSGQLVGHGTVNANGLFDVQVSGGNFTLGRTDSNEPLSVLGTVEAGRELVLRTFNDPSKITFFFHLEGGTVRANNGVQFESDSSSSLRGSIIGPALSATGFPIDVDATGTLAMGALWT